MTDAAQGMGEELPEHDLDRLRGNIASNPAIKLVALLSPNSHYDSAVILPDSEWQKVVMDEPWEPRKGFVIRFDGEERL